MALGWDTGGAGLAAPRLGAGGDGIGLAGSSDSVPATCRIHWTVGEALRLKNFTGCGSNDYALRRRLPMGRRQNSGRIENSTLCAG